MEVLEERNQRYVMNNKLELAEKLEEIDGDSLTALLRSGAKASIVQVVEAELAAYQHEVYSWKTAVVRNGYLPERIYQSAQYRLELEM